MKTLHPAALVHAIASDSNVPAFALEDIEREKIKTNDNPNIIFASLFFLLTFFIMFIFFIKLNYYLYFYYTPPLIFYASFISQSFPIQIP
jgi:uncharacterized membrane protein